MIGGEERLGVEGREKLAVRRKERKKEKKRGKKEGGEN